MVASEVVYGAFGATAVLGVFTGGLIGVVARQKKWSRTRLTLASGLIGFLIGLSVYDVVITLWR